MARKPVIAVAGLACETSTFSPSRTAAPAFHPQRGDEIVQRYAFLHDDQPVGRDAVWKGALIGHALPGGTVTREAYENLSQEIVQRLQAIIAEQPIDGLWFDIHGAMCVEDLDDAEADLLRRVRAVIGPDVLVSASMDLHGNVSRELAHMCDLITCYRMAPHEDTMETKERACRNLIAALHPASPGRRPLKAWVPVPILLPGEQTSTRMEPAKHIYAAVPEVEAVEGVLDAAIWVGYAWADEPRNRAVVVVTGWDAAAVSRGAEKLANLFWDARADFAFVAPTGTLDECLDAAVKSPAKDRPYFISDSGDNPTAGGSGDVTWGLTRLLARPEFRAVDSGYAVIYASVPGPEAVETAVAAGVGAKVTVTAGAKVDDLHAPPVTMTGRVHAIRHGDRDAETEVVIRVGCVHAILTRLRKPYHKERDFTGLGLDPRSADIVIVKIGYLEPELYDMAKGWMLGLTPGGVDQDLERLGHKRIRRPMWPFDKEFEHVPNLSARWIPKSNEPLSGVDE
ncbi:Microcystin LR degradation protein MlrC [Cordyceps fumosorosea ARSEF 2679]|uniref:Microcystin LR degradation protein MlrC n=1 Tax=Cordyceps fumosorosea (strain ARSEF 2679) TaxID=1081104 RepID=A0A167VYM7_CORFA|nr:Microcystin LR degradation protein MlrC [Cordyceps fumosorosea ARSEF 2679]OAA63126.1 Microcystin LR degradation protein MlrC [Cordyceps fumosorosea ARSEF 2679]